MIFSRDYLRVFVPIAIAFAIYQLTLVPFLETSVTPVGVRKWQQPTLAVRDEWWDEFFREDAWQRQSPQVLKTENGTLLYKDRVEISETRWHIKPLTILIPQRSSGTNKRAIFISNPEGAEIQFQRRPDWTSEPPPVETGLLLGKILIYAPPDDASEDNGLKIEASEVRIEKRQIWTDKSIKMEMGDSLIEGHNLTINLEQKLLTTDTTKSTKDTPFDGLESMELMYVDRVRIGLKPGGLWPNNQIADARTRPAHVVLKCGGRFSFSFLQSEAILRGGVHMEHRVDGLPVDTFDCEELRMQVGLHKGQESTQTAAVPAEQTNKRSPWKVDKLDAAGALGRDPSDHSRWLKLNAPGMKAEALAQHLFIDFLMGELNVSNSLPLTAVRESSPVYLRHDTMQIWAPEIQYRNPQTLGSIQSNSAPASTEAKRLGAVLATGPGTAQMENEGEPWRLSWGKRLLVRADEDRDLISIDGSANVRNPIQGSFVADQLHLWLRPVDVAIAQRLAPHYGDKKMPDWLPDRVRADRDVAIETPDIRANVQNMELVFLYPVNANASAVAPPITNPTSPVPPTAIGETAAIIQPQTQTSSPVASNILQQPKNGLPMTGLPGLPALTTPPIAMNPNNSTKSASSNKLGPVQVTARSLLGSIMNIGGQTQLDGLTLDGNFTMSRKQLSEESPWPFSATGSKLVMQQVNKDQSNIHLVGAPAKVAVGTGWVIAPELKLSQSEQMFWIDHPGELVIPPEAIPLQSMNPITSMVSAPSTMDRQGMGFLPAQPSAKASTTRWYAPPKLTWGERMTFDGRTARFGGNIFLTCLIENEADTLWHVAVQSQSLAIDMTQQVPFHTPNNGTDSPLESKTRAEVASIRFERNVDLKAVQTDREGRRRSTEHMKVPQLDILVPTQTFVGHGPGELWSRRFSGGNPLGGMASKAVSANSATSGDLQCMHLSFMGKMEGALQTRQVSFFHRIAALMGPISSWEEEVNVHRAERLGKNQTSLTSDQVNLLDGSVLSWNQTSPTNRKASDPAWEIQAVSHVRVETNTDQGVVTMEGETLKYAAQTDTVRIGGSPKQSAVITRVPIGGDPSKPEEYRLSNFAMQLRTGTMMAEISSIEGQLPANFQRAQPSAPAPGNGTGAPVPPANQLPSPRENNLFQGRAK
jgi:hypothetical protein